MRLNIGHKFLIIIGAAAFFSVSICIMVAYIISRDAIADQVNSQLISASTLKSERILHHVLDIQTHMNAYLQNNDIQASLIKLFQKNNESTKKDAKSIINGIVGSREFISNVQLIDTKDLIVISTQPYEEGTTTTSNNYLKAKPFFTQDLQKKDISLAMSFPIKSQNGKIVGYLVAKGKSEEMVEILSENTGLGNTGETFLVNSSHLVQSELLKESDAPFKRYINLPQINTCLDGTSNLSEKVDYHSDVVYGYWHWIPELDMCLVTKIDRKEALASLNTLIGILVSSSFGAIIVIGILGNIVGNFIILRPIHSVLEAISKIKGGNFNVRSSIQSTDEIGDIMVAVEEMAEKLQSSRKELEINTLEKTKQYAAIVENTQKQNQFLKDSKLAMQNLLEDSKALEEELQREKNSVQEKVVERTRELADEKAKLIASISSLPQAFIMIDTDEQIVVFNQRLESILGAPQSPGKWTLKEINSRLSDEFDLEEEVQQVIAEKKELQERDIVVGAKYVSVYIAPIFSLTQMKSHEVIGAIITITDVTEARVLSRSKDEFFSIASHELRTPLTAIRGNTSMILDYYAKELVNPDLKTMITDTHDASVRLIAIVNDFLDVSRLEQQRIEFVREQFNISELIEKALKEYQVTGSRSKLSLNYIQPKEELPLVLADKNRTRQVLVNLIGNSLKFTQKGGVTLSASIQNGKIEVQVSDTGRGITPAFQGLLFHKFQQAGDSIVTRDTIRGTGLGLYISKLLINGMGGDIWLEKTEVGKGSTFAFTLPISNSGETSSPTTSFSLGFTPHKINFMEQSIQKTSDQIS
jgi:signal transduction histidine kinase/HAMP domain-containing protein